MMDLHGPAFIMDNQEIRKHEIPDGMMPRGVDAVSADPDMGVFNKFVDERALLLQRVRKVIRKIIDHAKPPIFRPGLEMLKFQIHQCVNSYTETSYVQYQTLRCFQ